MNLKKLFSANGNERRIAVEFKQAVVFINFFKIASKPQQTFSTGALPCRSEHIRT